MELNKTALEAAIRVEFEGGNTQAVISAYLAALEDQGDDGWIEWKGGECPVDDRTRVDVKFTKSRTDCGYTAECWVWDNPSLIAYRIHKGA